jgi:hypothetical protein
MTMAPTIAAMVSKAAGITIAFRRHHRCRGGVWLSTGLPYALSRCTEGKSLEGRGPSRRGNSAWMKWLLHECFRRLSSWLLVRQRPGERDLARGSVAESAWGAGHLTGGQAQAGKEQRTGRCRAVGLFRKRGENDCADGQLLIAPPPEGLDEVAVAIARRTL